MAGDIREVTATGSEARDLAIELLHRVRLADPMSGAWEAADLEWWSRAPRRSDELRQTFWLDHLGPIAAALLTDWTRAWAFDPIAHPSVSPDLLHRAWYDGLARIRADGLRPVEVLVDDTDVAFAAWLLDRGFTAGDEVGAVHWMAAGDRAPARQVPDGFVLSARGESPAGQHPMVQRNGAEVEARLRATTLYDPDLDLAIRTADGDVAAYGLFWFDPVTKVGLVEPMRTEDAYQRRGLASALLGSGLARLAAKGATRLKVSSVSAAAGDLYRSVGFRTVSTDRTYVLANDPESAA